MENRREWWKESVVYQIYPRSFCDSDGDGVGDLPGIIGRLDYVKDLGVDVIWLSPVYVSPGADNGYDVADYKEIDPRFGTMADFDELLRQAHRRGLKIMMDLVVNHTSDQHQWFQESRKSRENPYRDFYIWREGKGDAPPNNWGSWYSGPAWEYDEATGMYYLHIFSKNQPDLNWENPRVRQEVYALMRWWLDKGVDGFRMDVINLISKAPGLPDGELNGTYGDLNPFCVDGPRVHEFLQEMNREVLSHYDCITVGEMPFVTVEEVRRFTGGDEVNMVFQFDFVDLDNGDTVKWSNKKIGLKELKEVFTKWQTGLEQTGWNSLFWNNHDQPRIVSRLGDEGEYWEKSAKMLATCLHMMKGTPYIYQGEELGMTSPRFRSIGEYRDVESLNAYEQMVRVERTVDEETMLQYLHNKSRDNARTPMQWSGGCHAGFTSGTPWLPVTPNFREINAEKQMGDPDSIRSYYQKLIRLRREEKAIISGSYRLLMPDSGAVFAFARETENCRLVVLCNFTGEPVENVTAAQTEEERELLICNYQEAGEETVLRPYEARVYRSVSRSGDVG